MVSFLSRLLPLLPRGWGFGLQLEDPLTGSLEEVQSGGHAIADKAQLLCLTLHLGETAEAAQLESLGPLEPWLRQQLGIFDLRIFPLALSPGERPFGRLLLVAGADGRRLAEILTREIAALVLGHALDGVDGAQRGDMPHRGNLDGDAPGASGGVARRTDAASAEHYAGDLVGSGRGDAVPGASAPVVQAAANRQQ